MYLISLQIVTPSHFYYASLIGLQEEHPWELDVIEETAIHKFPES